MSRPASPFSGTSGDTPEQSPKPESPATQPLPPTQVTSPSVVPSNDEQETDLETVLSKPFPRFDAGSTHKEYDNVAANQTRFEAGVFLRIDAFRALIHRCRNRG